MKKLIDEGIMTEYLEKNAALGLSGPKWEKYFRDKVEWLCKLSDGTIFAIEKPSIETEFCFGEHGYDYDDAVDAANEARRNENLFRIRNLRGINSRIALLESKPEPGRKIWVNSVCGVTDYLNDGHEWDMERVNGKTLEISGEDREKLLAGFKAVRERFSKRIDSYLKRYGLSKVRSWTYWADA